MSEWQKVKLGDVCQIIDGDRGKNYPKNHEFFGSGYCLFLNTGNVTKEGFSFANNQFITKEKDELLRKGKIQRGDLILTTRGTVGNIAYYTNHIKYENVRINSGMVILRVNKENVDASFLYQLVRSKESRTYINSFCTGSAQPQLPIKNLSQICFEIPSLSTQHRIATILSRYDSLIENYQKQIKLLEEAAQRLYKEWFVDLRFPGHENVKIVDGVPEGWEMKKVGEIAIISAGGDKPDVVTEEQTTECQVPIYSNGTTKEGMYGYTNKSSNTAGSITVSARGSIGFACLRMHDYFSIVRLISIKPQNNVDLMYLFQFTKVHTFMSNGAAQQQLTVPMVKAIDVVYPAESLLEAFENVVLPLYKKVQSLQSQLRLLAEARDRLLPKLMSAEIEV